MKILLFNCIFDAALVSIRDFLKKKFFLLTPNIWTVEEVSKKGHSCLFDGPRHWKQL